MSCQSEIEKILTKIPSIPADLHIYLRGPCHVDLRVEDDSWAVSALAVGIGVRAVTAADDFATFRFTLLPLGVCTPLILVLAVVIPYLCFRNLEKHSVVERLRME